MCPGCSVAREAAQHFASNDPAIQAVVVNDCTLVNLEASVDAQMVGLGVLPPGENDLFHREGGAVRIEECPGRVEELQKRFDNDSGIT